MRIKISKSAIVAFAIFSTLVLGHSPKTFSDTTYRIIPVSSFNSPNWELTGGTITTDGTLGELVTANIVDWSIDYRSNERTFNLNPGNTIRGFSSGTNVANGLTASATQLFMTGTPDAAGINEQFLFLESTPSFEFGIAFTSSEPSSVGGITLFDGNTNPVRADSIVFNGDSFIIGVVPEPGSSILLLGGAMVWLIRRKRD